jgi:hypothetical protein
VSGRSRTAGLRSLASSRARIDRAYPLEAIADAYCYVQTEQKIGIVIINVKPAGANALGATEQRG